MFNGLLSSPKNPNNDPTKIKVNFSTGGGSIHVTHSLGTTKYGSLSAPDFGGAIGVNADGDPEGVDIPAPKSAFDIAVTVPAVTGAMYKTWSNITGTTNAAPFWGFAAGEVLFLGADGGGIIGEDIEVSFKFEASPNVVLNYGHTDFTNVVKGGHDYIWFHHLPEEDSAAFALGSTLKAIYVEKVFRSASWASLPAQLSAI